MHCLWNINAWKLRFEPNSYYPWKIRSHFLAIDSYTGGQSGCFARIIVGRAVWENNCSKVMVSAYSKPLNLWVIAMAFRLVIDFESGKCQASPNLGMLTIWFPYIKRCMSDCHGLAQLQPRGYGTFHTFRPPERFRYVGYELYVLQGHIKL